jgi:hypothetical protein
VFRVLSRELLAPSRAMGILRERELIPKARILRSIVGEVMGLPDTHPAVARACINLLAPFILLLIGDRRTFLLAFPGLGLTAADAPALADHFVHYAIAGMHAAAGDTHAPDPATNGSRGARSPRRPRRSAQAR